MCGLGSIGGALAGAAQEAWPADRPAAAGLGAAVAAVYHQWCE